MTFTLVAMALSLGLAQPARAQGGIGIGAEGLVAFPEVTNVSEGLDAKAAYGGGLWIGGNKGGAVGFVGEFLYVVKTIEGDPGTSAKQYALEIPAVFHINIGSRKTNGALFYLVLGPVFTIHLKERLEGDLVNTKFSDTTVGAMAGAGFEWFRLGIEGRGNWGLMSLVDSIAGVENSDTKEFSFELVGKIRFN
jgi:hypothetical protein